MMSDDQLKTLAKYFKDDAAKATLKERRKEREARLRELMGKKNVSCKEFAEIIKLREALEIR